MNALQEQFVTEARELIAQATDDLIGLERHGSSPERIDRVFRAFHTLKGSAGVVDLPAMSITLHAAEDLLATVRQGTLRISADIIDQGLACLDQVSRWVDDFENTGALPARAGEDSRSMAEHLRSFLPTSGAPQFTTPERQSTPMLPEWVAPLLESERDRIASRMQTRPSPVFAISYEPHAGCFYIGDDPVQLMRQVPDLLAFRLESRDAWPPLVDLDPYACNLRLRAIAAGDRDEIGKIFRLALDQVRITDIPFDALPIALFVANDGTETKTLVRAVIEAQCELLRIQDRKADFAGCVGAAARTAANALRHAEQSKLLETVERAGATALSQHDAAPLLDALYQTLVALGRPSDAISDDIEVTSTNVAPGDSVERLADRVLRVNEAKIEALVNLAGELIVAKNALAHSAKLADQELRGHEVSGAIRRDHDAIDRLAIELHDAILQLRMVQVAQVFRSFPRLVRDLSHQLNKNVKLAIGGGTTEADKKIVDRLFEPLVHLVRNAVDHGIETAEQRRAAGKSETAVISIQASRIGDRLLVEVSDDGRGIDPAIIRNKASERSLMPDDELAALKDDQVIDLIFAAGFSTASAVSDISGRGFGMDVVRNAIEQIGGRVSLASNVGAGTAVRLDLPMTIAMSRIMVVETGEQLFGISMDAVSETVRLTPDRISRIKNNNGFVLRDRVVPIISLAELMKLPNRVKDEAAARLFLVIETGGKIAAFEIDGIRDRLEVVLKPMHGLLAGARGYAGTTLMGNGHVLLVLDVKEIMP